MNVSSLIVNARDGQADCVQALLTQQPGVEIHAASPEGKLIVTIETESDRETVAAYERIITDRRRVVRCHGLPPNRI
jgi:nitrate reductase NapD